MPQSLDILEALPRDDEKKATYESDGARSMANDLA